MHWNKNNITILTLLLIYLLGCYIRIDEFVLWNKFPNTFFYHEKPVLINGDGYYYMRLARDYRLDNYGAIDRLRSFPDSPPRPLPPPLISLLAAWISRVAGISIEFGCVLLPVFLAPLLLLPLFGITRELGGSRFMGIIASLFGNLTIHYVYRTSIGFYDTDCLNITLLLTITYLFMRFSFQANPIKRYVAFAGALIVFFIFDCHWDQARQVVWGIFFVNLFIALAAFYRPDKWEGLAFLFFLGALFLNVLFLNDMALLNMLVTTTKEMALSLFSDRLELFPVASRGITELKVFGINKIIARSTGNFFVFCMACVGFVAVLVRHGRKSLFLLILLLFAGLSFVKGNRFIIFFAPLIGLGIGFLAENVFKKVQPYPWLKPLVLIVIALSAYPMLSNALTERHLPAYADMRRAIVAVRQHTPANAVIWSTWDISNPIMYYAERRTISDAQWFGATYFSGERNFYQCLPIAHESVRFSANFIQFYVKNGIAGIHKVYDAVSDTIAGYDFIEAVLSEGPEKARHTIDSCLASGKLTPLDSLKNTDQWLFFLFPCDAPPVYLLFHQRLILSSWWYDIGSWDLKKGQFGQGVYMPMGNIRPVKNKLAVGEKLQSDFKIDSGGFIEIAKGDTIHRYPVTDLTLNGLAETRHFDYDQRNGLALEIFVPLRFGGLMSNDFASSTFNRLMIRRNGHNRYFKHIAESFPQIELWKVEGDTCRGKSLLTE